MALAQLNVNGYKLDLVEEDLVKFFEYYPDFPELSEVYDYLIRQSNYPPLMSMLIRKDFIKPETAQFVIDHYLENTEVMIGVLSTQHIASLITIDHLFKVMSISDCVVSTVARSLTAFKKVDQVALAQRIVDHGSVSAILRMVSNNDLPGSILDQLINHSNKLISWQTNFAQSHPKESRFYLESVKC